MKNFNDLIKSLTDQFLLESPFYVGKKPLYINLDDPEFNKNKFDEVVQNNPNKLDTFNGYDVFRSLDKQTRHDTFYFVNKNTIEGLVGVEDKDGIAYSKAVAKRNISENKTLIQDIFLNYFPTIYYSVVSDEYMNDLGKTFWKKLLELSLTKGYSNRVLISNTGEEKDYFPEKFESYWNHESDPVIRRPSPTRMLFKIYYR
jgi:hypothetical protein